MMDCGVASAWCQESREDGALNGCKSLETSWEMKLNITATRPFLAETAPGITGLVKPFAKDPPKWKLCCHTVVGFFNCILKMTFAAFFFFFFIFLTWNMALVRGSGPRSQSEVSNMIFWHSNLLVIETCLSKINNDLLSFISFEKSYLQILILLERRVANKCNKYSSL